MSGEEVIASNASVSADKAEQDRLKGLRFRDFDDGLYMVDDEGNKIGKVVPGTPEHQEWQDRITKDHDLGTTAERQEAIREGSKLSLEVIEVRKRDLTKWLADKIIDDPDVRKSIEEDIARVQTDEDVHKVGGRIMPYKDTPESVERERSERSKTTTRTSGFQRAQERILKDVLETRVEELKKEGKPMSAEDFATYKREIEDAESTAQLQAIQNKIRRHPRLTVEEQLRAQDEQDKRGDKGRAKSADTGDKDGTVKPLSKEEEREYEHLKEEYEKRTGKKWTGTGTPPLAADKGEAKDTKGGPSTDAYNDADLKEIQKNLEEELLQNSEVNETEKKELLQAIRGITNEASYMPVYQRIYSLQPKKKGEGERKPAKDNDKGVDTRGAGRGYNPTSARTLETLPDGRIQIIERDPNTGVATVRHEAGKSKDLYAEYGPDYRRTATEAAIAEARVAAARSALPKQPGILKRVIDWVSNKPVQRDRDLEYMLYEDPNASPEELKTRQWIEQRTSANNGRRAMLNREINEGGYAKFFSKENLKGTPWAMFKTVSFVTAAAAIGAVTGLWAPFALSAIGGSLAGSFVQKYMQNYLERTGDRSAKITSIILGSIVGLATGTVAYKLGVDQVVANTGLGKWVSSFFSGGGAAIPTGLPGGGAILPNIPFCPDFLIEPSAIGGNGSVWSQLFDGLQQLDNSGFIDISNQGQKAFTEAFHKVAIDYQDVFLQKGGRMLEGIPWDKIPDGTVPRFDKIFANPDFLKDLCETIKYDYPSLAREIGGSDLGVKSFIKEIAYSYGAR